MRLLTAAFVTILSTTAALAQPTNNVMHEMTNIGKQKDNEGQRLQPIEKKRDSSLFTVVGGGVNTGDEAKGDVTVVDDGGPATKAPVAEKPVAKAVAPEPDLWDDFMSNFEEGEAKSAAKPTAPVAPAVQKPVTVEAPKAIAPAPVTAAPKPVEPVTTPKAEAKPVAVPAKPKPQTSVIGNEPTSTLWEDMGSFFEETFSDQPAAAN